MNSPEINFSHRYFKLRTVGSIAEEAHLLAVFKEDIGNLDQVFLQYDTIHPNGYYGLPKNGSILILLFQKKGLWNCFTTIRPWSKEKESYYRELIGQTFSINIKPTIGTNQ